MLKTLKIQRLQKTELIKDILTREPKTRFRGLPTIDNNTSDDLKFCSKICPTNAIINSDGEYKIDLGKCTMCGECVHHCKNGGIKFANSRKLSATKRQDLVVNGAITPIETSEAIKKFFGKSLKLRQVSAGGCNACEMELNASSNANFDIGRFGIEFVASPRHADGVVITGPVTKNMAKALEDTYFACAEPRIVVAVGACAISGGVYAESEEIDRTFFEKHPPDLYIAGCPAHPLTIVSGILDLIGYKK